MKRILIVGFGDVAERLVKRYAGQAEFIGMVRRPERAAELRALGVTPYVGDLDAPATLQRLPRADGVFHFAPPPGEGRTDRRTAHLLHALGRRKPAALVYISTSGVYGDCAGSWVSETRPVAPVNGRAVRRVDAERQLRAWGERQRVQVSILRAPGIYAADRLPLERIRRGTPALVARDDSYTNHIHADDLARLAWAALFRGRSQRIYHAVDAHPLKMGDWFDSCADAFGLPRPPRVKRDEAEKVLSEALLSFLRESRQLSNARTTKELRLKYRYPTSDDLLREIRQTRGQMDLF
jgi:nucleoside-diphosphate-sugar epimerase